MKEQNRTNTQETTNVEPLYVYQFIDNSGCIFQVTAHSRAEAAKIAREQI